MPTVQVHCFAAARAAVGAAELTLNAATLGEVGDQLSAAYPDFRRVRPQCSYLLNETVTHGDPYAVTLAPNDRIDILPPFAGGST